MRLHFKINLLQNVWIYLLSIFVISLLFQSHLLMSKDVAWLIHAARELLAGGTYTNNFFEPNPPMSIYIYVPVVFIAKLTHLSLLLSFYFYIFTLAIGSFLFCSYLIDQLLPIHVSWLMKNGLKISLALSFLILPIMSFGQREHIMVLLITPYIFSLALLLEQKAIKPWQIFLIGLLAGIGFCIKPYFLLVFAACEIYLAARTQSLRYTFRIENLLIVAIIFLYLISIWIVTPDYIHTVLPIISPIYYYDVSFPYTEILSQKPLLFWLFGVIAYSTLRKIADQKSLLDLFAIASISFFIVYLIQRTTWYYHLYPMFVFSSLLNIILFAELFEKSYFNSNKLLCRKNFIFGWVLVLVIFMWQFVINSTVVLAQAQKNSTFNDLVAFVKEKASHSNIYLLNNHILFTSTLEYYTSAKSVSRFPSQWILFADAKLSKIPHSQAQSLQIEKTRDFVINPTITELKKFQPVLVLVQSTSTPENLHYHYDCLQILLQNPQFRTLWKNYHFSGTIDGEDIYQKP